MDEEGEIGMDGTNFNEHETDAEFDKLLHDFGPENLGGEQHQDNE